MPMPKVTAKERAFAREAARDMGPIEQRGVDTATLVGTRLRRETIAYYRKGRTDVTAPIRKHLRRIIPDLRDAMVLAYLTGAWRARVYAVKQTLSLSLFSQIIRYLARRVEITREELLEIANKFTDPIESAAEQIAVGMELKILETISGVTERGEHVREGVQALNVAFDLLGVTPRNSYQLETIYRTHTQMAYKAGEWNMYKDPAIQEILWGFKYVTVGDRRVRDEHEPLDGVLLPRDDPFWLTSWPPNDWGCRCDAIPVFEESEPVRPPKEAEVDGKMVVPGPSKDFAVNFAEQLNLGEVFKVMPQLSN